MRDCRKLIAFLLSVSLLSTGTLSAKAQQSDAMTCRRQILQAYSRQQLTEVEAYLGELEREDPEQGRLWRRIMDDCDWLNHAGYSSARTLPDDLPQDDSLCIVVFGYGLNSDGSMKPELASRLQVALNGAMAYPNACIAVTGGETAGIRGISEASVMAIWLMNNGISEDRIILEGKALSTTDNAVNTYRLIEREYPQIHRIAVVTSDYHVSLAAVVMQTVSTWESATNGTREIPVIAGASCETDTTDHGSCGTQASGIARITGTDWGAARSTPSGVPSDTSRDSSEETDFEIEERWYEQNVDIDDDTAL